MEITEEQKQELIKEHYRKIGKKGGETQKKKGSKYFSWVRSHRKNTPKQQTA